MNQNSAEKPTEFVCSIKDPIHHQVYIIKGTYHYSREDELFVAHINQNEGVIYE